MFKKVYLGVILLPGPSTLDRGVKGEARGDCGHWCAAWARIGTNCAIVNSAEQFKPGHARVERRIPIINVSFVVPLVQIPVALNTYPLLPVLPTIAVDRGSGDHAC